MKILSATQATALSLKNAKPALFEPPKELAEFIAAVAGEGKFSGVYRGPIGIYETPVVQEYLTGLGYTVEPQVEGVVPQIVLRISWNSQPRY